MARLLVLIIILILIIALGAVGLVYFRVIPDFTGLIAPIEEKVAPEPEPVEEETEALRSPNFQDLPPFVVPVIENREVKNNFTIHLRLDVAAGRAAVLDRRLSKLQAAYLNLLYSAVPEQARVRNTLDLRVLKKKLKKISDKILGPDVVHEVLISSVFDR